MYLSFLPSCCIIKLVSVSLESGIFVVERTFSLQISLQEIVAGNLHKVRVNETQKMWFYWQV